MKDNQLTLINEEKYDITIINDILIMASLIMIFLSIKVRNS